MGDNSSSDNGHPAAGGHPGHVNSPLRIFTRSNSADHYQQQRLREDMSPRPRDPRDQQTATNTLLSSAFSRPYGSDGGELGKRSASASAVGQQLTGAAVGGGGASVRVPRKPAKFVPRVGRNGTQYHPLPSYWRDAETGSLSSPTNSSGLASPVTPESVLGEEAGSGPRSLPHQPNSPLAIETSRSFQSSRDYQQQQQARAARQAVAVGQSPVVSPRIQVGMLKDAFDSASSLEWQNDRPGSTYSYQSIDQPLQPPVQGQSEIQAESPVDVPAHGGRFPPALSSMAVRPGGTRGGLGLQQHQHQQHQQSRHHASASTSSSHYSYIVNSPPARGASPLSASSTAQSPPVSNSVPLSEVASATATPPLPQATSTPNGEGGGGAQGEDIVRRYFSHQHQRRVVTAGSSVSRGVASQDLLAPSAAPPSATQQHAVVEQKLLEVVEQASSNEGEHTQAIGGYRRALSSGDLPGLEEEEEGSLQSYITGGPAGSKSFLAPDLVESPLEALVRRLTIELFQLYVNEDRRKAGIQKRQAKRPGDQQQLMELDRQRKGSLASLGGDGDASGGKGDDPRLDDGSVYIQQFRLGPSLRSGSTTPAVTMDGYFVPQKHAAGEGAGGPKPRPRHRLVQRTWMEEALIKARRVSTIDEHAEESILQGLDRAIAARAAGSPLLLPPVPAASDASASSSPPGNEDLAQFSAADGAQSQRGAQKSHVSAGRGMQSSSGPSGLAIHTRGVSLGASQPQQAGPGRTRPRPKLDLAKLSEEPFGSASDPRTQEVISELANDRHPKSPRGYYRARDPAAPHRKQLPVDKRSKERLLNISPARASLLRAVGRRQSIRLQPGKGQIVVAETQLGPRSSSGAIGAGALGDANSSRASAPVTLEPDAVARAKRSNSLPGLMQVPETKEVSYQELQKKAARNVELKKALRSRARVVHRAERMVLGGSLPPGSRADDSAPAGGRRRHAHKRAGSRADMDMQLIKVELPPPVPLRVRREQVKLAPEPLIIVRRPAKKPRQEAAATADTTEQEMLRVHNQLLGAQAVLSRHNTVVVRRNITPTNTNANANRFSALNPHMLLRPLDSNAASDAASSKTAADIRPAVKNAVRSEALDVVMLDNALNDHIEKDEQQRFADEKQRRRRDRREKGRQQGGRAAGDETEGDVQPVKPWRSARRRSTLRKKGRSHQGEQTASADAAAPRAHAAQERRLLLHGPAYRIYSGIKARPDTYLFLFTDMLVVTTRVFVSQPHAGFDPMSMMAMAPPSPDANTVPSDSRFKVHIVIPLARSITALRFARESGSKRPGEDDEAEENRLSRQEERIRRACHMFEKNTSEAVVYLINRDIIDPVPEVIAGFLYRCTALSRRQLGHFLGAGILGENLHENPTLDEVDQEKQFHRQIWISFLDRCDLVGVPIDEALRSVLFYVRLPNNPRSISVLLEVVALQWYVKNIEQGQSGNVFLPDSQDVAVKLAFAIMTLNTELHNPLLRGEIQPEVAFRDLTAKFRAALVDDPAVAGKRKGNVLRKRDQPRVVTIMEVPTENLRAIFERVAANRLVTCSDARPAAPEFEIDWIRDASDLNSPALTDEQVEHELEDVYCDPGFRDGLLFNASSDRLPAKFSINLPAWLRVTVRIPEPDPKLSIRIRVVGAVANAGGGEVVSVAPSPRLTFRTSGAASFIIRPHQIGHFTMHFISEGSHARYYHPIPSRTMVVEGAFMQHTVQISWRRGDGQGHKARHMFGMDSQPTKNQWARCLEAALKGMADTPSKEVAKSVERATMSLSSLAPASTAGDHQQQLGKPADASLGKPEAGTMPRSMSGGDQQGITSVQLLSALGTL